MLDADLKLMLVNTGSKAFLLAWRMDGTVEDTLLILRAAERTKLEKQTSCVVIGLEIPINTKARDFMSVVYIEMDWTDGTGNQSDERTNERKAKI